MLIRGILRLYQQSKSRNQRLKGLSKNKKVYLDSRSYKIEEDKSIPSSPIEKKVKSGILVDVDGNLNVKKPIINQLKLPDKLNILDLDSDESKIKILPSIEKLKLKIESFIKNKKLI
jgi:hypothetical protein